MVPDDAISCLDGAVSRACAIGLVERSGRKPLPALLLVTMAATPLCVVSPLEVSSWSLHASCMGCLWVKTLSNLGRATMVPLASHPPWRHRFSRSGWICDSVGVADSRGWQPMVVVACWWWWWLPVCGKLCCRCSGVARVGAQST